MKATAGRYSPAGVVEEVQLQPQKCTSMRWIVLFQCLLCLQCWGQNRNLSRIFQLSLTPGLSTNGLHPGGFTNYFSLNLTSGYSARNYIFELGLISNLNEEETRGLQFAGLANLTGANKFAGLQFRELEKAKREGMESNLTGIQVSGLANVVLDRVFGGQTSGGVNVVKGALHGFQLAGISNMVGKYAFGIQLAGVYNVAVESMDGVQISSVFNITQGGLFGIQVAIFNKAGFIEGVNSFINDKPTGLQLGLVNHSKSMNGFQIGLVNISKSMQGTQIGLVNIYNNGKSPQTRDGTSIGLINIGSSGYVSVYASDVFLTNVEIATGTFKNHRINADLREKQIQNGLIYAMNPGFLSENEAWALGYGLKKFYFNRSIAPGYHKLTFFAAGLDLLHVNHERKTITKELSFLGRPHISFGSRLHPKNKRYYIFGAIAYNVYHSAAERRIPLTFSETSGNKPFQHWPGFAAGILIQ